MKRDDAARQCAALVRNGSLAPILEPPMTVGVQSAQTTLAAARAHGDRAERGDDRLTDGGLGMKDFDPCWHGKPLRAGDDAESGRDRSVEDIDQPHRSSPNYEYASMPELDKKTTSWE